MREHKTPNNISRLLHPNKHHNNNCQFRPVRLLPATQQNTIGDCPIVQGLGSLPHLPSTAAPCQRLPLPRRRRWARWALCGPMVSPAPCTLVLEPAPRLEPAEALIPGVADPVDWSPAGASASSSHRGKWVATLPWPSGLCPPQLQPLPWGLPHWWLWLCRPGGGEGTLGGHMIRLQAVLARPAPTILLCQEGHRIQRVIELGPVSVGSRIGGVLPEHGIVALPARSPTTPGLPNHIGLVGQQLVNFSGCWLATTHAYVPKHCTQLRMSGISLRRWDADLEASPAEPRHRSASILSRSSSAMSTNSPRQIFPTNQAGTGGNPSPRMNA